MNLNLDNYRYAIIGCGKIGSMILKTLIELRINKANIIATVKSQESLEKLRKEFPDIKVLTNNEIAIQESDVVFICTKPNQTIEILSNFKEKFNNKLVIYTAAGIPHKYIFEKVYRRSIKVIPNILGYVGKSLNFIYPSPYVSNTDVELVIRIFSKIGQCYIIQDDHRIDILTICTSCGPAFLAYVLESYVKGCVLIGLKYDEAIKYLIQLLEGILLMLKQGYTLQDIINLVTTPGGLTIYGIYISEREGLTKAIMSMLYESCRKIKEFSSKYLSS